jgi:integral membrane sensor domain MASE1
MSGPGLNVPLNDPRMPALRRVRPPAFLLLCVGLLDIFFCVAVLTLSYLGVQIMPLPPGADPASLQQAQPMTWQVLLTILGAIVARALSIWGAWNAFNLRSWGLVVVGSVTAMMPLAPACCLGLPVGAWMLFVLNAPEVRQHFT